jgi:hypothetical protein
VQSPVTAFAYIADDHCYLLKNAIKWPDLMAIVFAEMAIACLWFARSRFC